MNKLKVRAHTCYLGHTGYAAHARGFFRSLSKFCDLRVRNFNWDSAENYRKYVTPTDLEILDQITLSTGPDQLVDFPIQEVGEFHEFGFQNRPEDFKQDVDIVLIEPSHYYFFQNYTAKTKIAYTVWESTKVSDLFLQVLQRFDAVWVVSQWHKDCLIAQGVSEFKIWVVPEGVDDDFSCDNKFEPVEEYLDNRFKFLFFGRWDYRKSVPEIIESFLSEFSPEEPVDLVLSADNPFSIDGLHSTEQRLEKYGFVDPRIKIKHFPSRQEYLSYLHNGHAMITCARSEGWNIPLCEAIAAGIPVTYSNWGAQLEFCQGLATPVNVLREVPTEDGLGRTFENGYDVPGNYCLPDYSDLKRALRHIYTNYFAEKARAINSSKTLRENFNWNRIGEIGSQALVESVESNKKIAILLDSLGNLNDKLSQMAFERTDTLVFTNVAQNFDTSFLIYQKQEISDLDKLNISLTFVKNLDYNWVLLESYGEQFRYDLSKSNQEILDDFQIRTQELERIKIGLHFVDGARVEVFSRRPGQFLVSFIDYDRQELVYESVINSNNWCGPNRKWFTRWLIQVRDLSTGEIIFEHLYNAENQRIMICLESSSLGDTIAWLPAIEEFRKKHNCRVYLSTFRNELFEKEYPEINFIAPGTVVYNLYALYRIGWYYADGQIDLNRNPIDPKTRPMQATSFDILGIEHSQIRTKMTLPDEPRRIEEPYVCIGIHATAQTKYWNNPTGWQELVDWFNQQGYKVVLISREEGNYMGNQLPTGIIDKTGNLPVSERIIDLKYAKMFIGVGSGLSWLAWATGTPTVIISGFSSPETEVLGDDVLRIFNPETCNSCFNRFMLDAGDWLWCPEHKGTERHFECTKSITGQQVISQIQDFLTKL